MRSPGNATTAVWRLLEGYTPLSFVTGAVVMCVELVGARMLAPHFGATLYAWTAVIAITLVGLTAGYALGGWISDRPAARPLALLLLAAGGFLIALPAFDAAFIALARGLGIRLGALLAALGILMIPLTALAAVGPPARITTSSPSTPTAASRRRPTSSRSRPCGRRPGLSGRTARTAW